MTFLRPLEGTGTGSVATPALQGLIWAVMKPLGWNPAVDVTGHNMIPLGAPRLTTLDRAASGTVSFVAYVMTGSITFTELAVRHRVAGGAATNILYQVWLNSVPVAAAIATVAANSTTEVIDGTGNIVCVTGDRIEIVVQVAATISDANMPEDVSVYLG